MLYTRCVVFLVALACTSASELDYVTCGSVIKLVNVRSDVRLHSHDVKYGSGSGQQSVTGVHSTDDNNSYWQIKAKQGVECPRGRPVKCGQVIRLMHLQTRKNLHSHHFNSPLSNNHEVSAFGEDGVGDDGDNWNVVCNDLYWERDAKVRFKHGVTGRYLHVTGDTFGRPIHGQSEICAYSNPNEFNYWITAEGVYVRPQEDSDRLREDDDEGYKRVYDDDL
ncbi:stromal cell-derived factor 2-like [Watersipora subatra]|uniref:stromal cell-derived factor 2-like n=1 Tax=Watersipora subatra TaxID=2589382 RepID=UPI00355AD5AD